MKLAPAQRKRSRTVPSEVQKIGPSKNDREGVPLGAIITGNDEVITFPVSENHSSSKDSVPEHMKELNLLSLGKKLLDCCKVGNVQEAKYLMEEGAPFIADWVGTSPLHFAVLNRHVEVAELLLQQGISRDIKNKVGRTPLHVAAQLGLSYMVKLLLVYGVEVSCKDMLGMTPLHWAAESGDVLTVKILIDYGADCHVKDKFGKTPGLRAKRNQHLDVLKVIQETDSVDQVTRNQRAANLRLNLLTNPRDMKPVAEIYEPPLGKRNSKPERNGKKVVVIATDSDGDEGPAKTTSEVDLEAAKISSSSEEMSKDSAIKLLKSHGVTMIEPDDDTTLTSAVLGGHTIRLTDAGKLAFKSLEKNCWEEKKEAKSSESANNGPTLAKMAKHSNGTADSSDIADDVIVGSKIADCTIDLPPLTSNLPNFNFNIPHDIIEGQPERHALYISRLKEKKKEILRHLEIIENQRTIKQNELISVSQQIRMMESITQNKNS